MLSKNVHDCKKGENNILKIFTSLLIILVLLSTSGCMESKKAITIKATIEENEAPLITSLEAKIESIPALKYPKDIKPNFPGVYVLIISGNNRVNYWTSIPYTGPGIYEITTGLRFDINEGETARVIVTVNDESGDRVAINTSTIII
jgi:hypothetical protein